MSNFTYAMKKKTNIITTEHRVKLFAFPALQSCIIHGDQSVVMNITIDIHVGG